MDEAQSCCDDGVVLTKGRAKSRFLRCAAELQPEEQISSLCCGMTTKKNGFSSTFCIYCSGGGRWMRHVLFEAKLMNQI
jgi:hypothetical protein